MAAGASWVDILEAAYRVEASEQEWLTGLLEAARPMLDHGRGVLGATYDASNPAAVQYRTVVVLGRDDAELVLRAQRAASPDDIEKTLRSAICGTASQLLGPRFEHFATIKEYGRPLGVYDSLGVNACDPTGVGCMCVGLLPREMKLDARAIATWERVAAHIAAAFRVRRRLLAAGERVPDGAEALLRPDGTAEHAQGEAVSNQAQRQLRVAVVAMDRARGDERRLAPECSVAAWKGLVAARWTLLDHFETDGRRYVVARENQAMRRGLGAFSTRERQVVEYACLGHANKLIAYELGVSHSTVRVLMARAAAKLGVASREDLVRAYVERGT